MSAEFNISLSCPTTEALNQAIIEHLVAQGYHIEPPGSGWERLIDFLKRVKISNAAFHCALAKYEARGNRITLRCGPTGSIREIVSNKAFDAFCRGRKGK